MSVQEVYENGTYYNPAWKHYGKENINVQCDRCYRDNLSVCIGYGENDLCMKCVDSLGNQVRLSNVDRLDRMTLMLQEQFVECEDLDSHVETRMMQRMFRNNEEEKH